MRRLAILLTIGILGLGGLCLDFAMANAHHVADYGQTAVCDGADSVNDNHCLAHHGDSVTTAIVAINNIEPPSLKGVTHSPNNSLLVLHEGEQVRRIFSENKLIDGIKLTGTVIKRE